jgi:hypothetical protein
MTGKSRGAFKAMITRAWCESTRKSRLPIEVSGALGTLCDAPFAS